MRFCSPRGLDRAVSGAEMNRIQTAAVGYYLDFKMIEIRNSLLNQNALVLELPEGHNCESCGKPNGTGQDRKLPQFSMPPPPAEAFTKNQGLSMPCPS